MIVLFGATGSTGGHLARLLKHGGHNPVAAVRNPDRARAALGPHAELVHGDLEDSGSLDRALRGATKVYCAVGGATGTPELVKAERALIDACKHAGVQHYVKVSGIDAPTRKARIQQWHADIEDHLLASGIPCTILRPTFFMQNFLGLAPAIRSGVLPLPTGDARAALIDARDISAVAATVLTRQGHTGKVYTLTGPKALDHAQAAAILAKGLDRPVAFANVPAQAFRDGGVQAGMPPWFADLLTDVYVKVFATGLADRATGDVEAVTGQPPRTLEVFVQDHRAALLG